MNENEMKEKLRDLIEKWFSQNEEDSISDFLIENGVIVVPCKVGDKVYMPWKWNGNSGIAELTVEKINIQYRRFVIQTNFRSDDLEYWIIYNCGVFDFYDLGKKIFLTFDEAQNVLIEANKI